MLLGMKNLMNAVLKPVFLLCQKLQGAKHYPSNQYPYVTFNRSGAIDRRLLGIILSSVLSVGLTLWYVNRNSVHHDDPTAGLVSSVDANNPNAVASSENAAPNPDQKIDLVTDESGLSRALVTLTTTRGKIKFRFYSNEAPKTVARIVKLIQQGFYNGLTFHRVVPGFVIQGGDPTGTGMGGTGEKLKAEFNQHKHVPGAVAMARTQDPDSADCQFYISLGTHPHLDNQYTVFGMVVEGLDIANTIQAGDRMVQVQVE
jgi:cyclophilin family peptidyl-prolyl cis-trans isomerase